VTFFHHKTRIPPISIKGTMTSDLNSLNTNKEAYDVGI